MTDPDTLRLLRDRLLVLGYPADDLPDWAVSLLAEGLEDKARLEWVEAGKIFHAVLWPSGSDWEANQGGTEWHRGPTLRDAIDAARSASVAEESRRDRGRAQPGPLPAEAPRVSWAAFGVDPYGD